MTRQTKTPRQRAEEALGVAERRVKRLTDTIEKAAADLEELRRLRADAITRREYAAADPALDDRMLEEKEEPTDG